MKKDNFLEPNLIPQASQEKSKSKGRLWKKVLLGLSIAIVSPVVGTIGLLSILAHLYPYDSPLIDNSQILLQPVSVSSQDNGFYDLSGVTDDIIILPNDNKGITNKLLQDYFDTANPAQWNQPLANKIVRDNQKTLTLVTQAANKNSFQIPEYSNPANLGPELKVYAMNPWREAARLQAIYALSLMHQDQPSQALTEAAKLSTLGHKMIISHNSLIGMLVGMATRNLGHEVVLQILSHGTPNSLALQKTSEAIKNSNNNIQGYKNALKFEYTGGINTIDVLNQDLIDRSKSEAGNKDSGSEYKNVAYANYFYKPNQTKNLYTNVYRAEIDNLGTECHLNSLVEKELQIADQIGKTNLLLLVFQENPVGKFLFSLTGSAYESLLHKTCETDLLSNIVQIELALKDYKISHGSLPQSLEDLVPKYFTAIPLDPFDKKSLRYSAEKKILYSVGASQKDLGGSEGSDWRMMANPTFKIGF